MCLARFQPGACVANNGRSPGRVKQPTNNRNLPIAAQPYRCILGDVLKTGKRVVTLFRNEYYIRVQILRTWLVAAMALLYLPASGYCLLEKASLVTPVACCPETTSHEHDEKSSCGGFGCCPIEYAVYSSLDSGTADLTTPPADVVFLTVVLLTELPAEVSSVHLERSPPDIPKSWQFFFRTALSPRAPSFLS